MGTIDRPPPPDEDSARQPEPAARPSVEEGPGEVADTGDAVTAGDHAAPGSETGPDAGDVAKALDPTRPEDVANREPADGVGEARPPEAGTDAGAVVEEVADGMSRAINDTGIGDAFPPGSGLVPEAAKVIVQVWKGREVVVDDVKHAGGEAVRQIANDRVDLTTEMKARLAADDPTGPDQVQPKERLEKSKKE